MKKIFIASAIACLAGCAPAHSPDSATVDEYIEVCGYSSGELLDDRISVDQRVYLLSDYARSRGLDRDATLTFLQTCHAYDEGVTAGMQYAGDLYRAARDGG